MKRLRGLSIILAVLALVTACSGGRGGSVAGNPSVHIEIGPNLNNALSTLALCPMRLSAIDSSGNVSSVDLPSIPVSLSANATPLTSLTIPQGTYSQFTLDVSTACSGGSVQLANTNGTFSALQTVTLKFSGSVDVTSTTDTLQLGMHAIVNQLATVSASSEIKQKAESTAGNIQAGGTTVQIQHMLQSADGSAYWFAGTSTGPLGGTVQGVRGPQDVFVTKYDASANPLWTVEFGCGGGTLDSRGLTGDGSGNIWVFGTQYATSLTCTTVGGTRINPGGNYYSFAFWAKIDPNGQILFLRELGASTQILPRITMNGSTPYMWGNYDFDVHADNNYGKVDAQMVTFLLKIDPLTGNKTYLSAFGMTNNFGLTSPSGLAFDALGNVYIAGGNNNIITPGDVMSGAATVGTQGANNAFVLKTDSTGALTWGKQFGAGAGSASSFYQGVWSTTGDTAVIVAGTTSGILGGTQFGTHGSTDLAVISLAPNGTVNWIDQQGAGASHTVTPANAIREATGGGDRVVMTGSTNGTLGGTQLGSHGTQDLFLATFNADGTRPVAVQLGAAGASTDGTMVRGTPSQNYYLVEGSTDGNLGGTQSGTHGTTDGFVAKITSAGALSWVTQLGGGVGTNTTMDYGEIRENSSNEIFWTGATTGNLGGSLYGTLGGTHSFGMKLSSGGAPVWASQFGAGAGTFTKPQPSLYGTDTTGIAIDGDLIFFAQTNADIPGHRIGPLGNLDAIFFKLGASNGVLK